MVRKLSEAQIWLLDYWREMSPFIATETEFRFCPDRKWRFDFALPLDKIAIEIEGGVFIQGRHARGAGIRNDIEKYNTAAALGWKVFRFLPEQILKGQAKEFLEKHLICVRRGL